MLGIGYYATLLDVLLRFSRIHDLLIPTKFHVAAVVAFTGLVALLFTGRLFSPLAYRIGRYAAFYIFWMMLAVGVSIWPGGAYSYFVNQWLKTIVTFFFIVGFIRTFKHLRTTVFTLAAGCSVAAFATLIYGKGLGDGRTALEGMTFGNSNDLALILLFGAPLSSWFIFNRKAPLWQRLGFTAGLVAAVPVLAGTGSRAGLLCLGVLSVYMFTRLSAVHRIRLAVLAALLIPAAVALVPRHLIVRYSTFFTEQVQRDPLAGDADETDEVTAQSAAESANMRYDLLKRSVVVTLQNPVLGVGPGMFVVAENELAVADGYRRGYWKSSHNMYTQISSELGIIGLITYLLTIGASWKAFGRAEKCDPRLFSFARELRTLGLALKGAMLVFLMGGVTLSIAYAPFLPALSGIAVVLTRMMNAAEAERRRNDERERENPASEPQRAGAGEVLVAARSGIGQAVARS